MGSLRVAKRGGGKTPVILLYQKIILFASKKLRSCRNTWKNVRFRFLLFYFNSTCGSLCRSFEISHCVSCMQLIDWGRPLFAKAGFAQTFLYRVHVTLRFCEKFTIIFPPSFGEILFLFRGRQNFSCDFPSLNLSVAT